MECEGALRKSHGLLADFLPEVGEVKFIQEDVGENDKVKSVSTHWRSDRGLARGNWRGCKGFQSRSRRQGFGHRAGRHEGRQESERKARL
jgi:hypothetical protein